MKRIFIFLSSSFQTYFVSYFGALFLILYLHWICCLSHFHQFIHSFRIFFEGILYFHYMYNRTVSNARGRKYIIFLCSDHYRYYWLLFQSEIKFLITSYLFIYTDKNNYLCAIHRLIYIPLNFNKNVPCLSNPLQYVRCWMRDSWWAIFSFPAADLR